MKSGNLNFLEPSEAPHACNGTDLPLPYSVRAMYRLKELSDMEKYILNTRDSENLFKN
jgi:hypothetical protein